MTDPIKLTIIQQENTLQAVTLDGNKIHGLMSIEVCETDISDIVTAKLTVKLHAQDGQWMLGRARKDD